MPQNLEPNYQKAYEEVLNFFPLGAPNKSGTSIQTMNKDLLVLNLLSIHLAENCSPKNIFEALVSSSLIGKVFGLGNCGRQAETLFLHILTEGYFNKRLELLYMDGSSLIGMHHFVVADREQDSDLNNITTWKKAIYIDTWSKQILSGSNLTSLSKEKFAQIGRMDGNITVRTIYSRNEKLSTQDFVDIIKYLKECKASIAQKPFSQPQLSTQSVNAIQDLSKNFYIPKIYEEIDREIFFYQNYCEGENSILSSQSFFKAINENYNKNKKPRAYYEEGIKLFKSGKIQEACDAFTYALNGYCDIQNSILEQARCYSNLASCFRDLHDYKTAEENAKQAIKLFREFGLLDSSPEITKVISKMEQIKLMVTVQTEPVN